MIQVCQVFVAIKTDQFFYLPDTSALRLTLNIAPWSAVIYWCLFSCAHTQLISQIPLPPYSSLFRSAFFVVFYYSISLINLLGVQFSLIGLLNQLQFLKANRIIDDTTTIPMPKYIKVVFTDTLASRLAAIILPNGMLLSFVNPTMAITLPICCKGILWCKIVTEDTVMHPVAIP